MTKQKVLKIFNLLTLTNVLLIFTVGCGQMPKKTAIQDSADAKPEEMNTIAKEVHLSKTQMKVINKFKTDIANLDSVEAAKAYIDKIGKNFVAKGKAQIAKEQKAKTAVSITEKQLLAFQERLNKSASSMTKEDLIVLKMQMIKNFENQQSADNYCYLITNHIGRAVFDQRSWRYPFNQKIWVGVILLPIAFLVETAIFPLTLIVSAVTGF